ncbi:MAG: O-antigen ligase family protein, partial [Acidobacteriota bacterium]
MKGLILIYLITVVAALVALRRPKIGLYVYICFSVLRPQSIWGWAGDLNSISLLVGVALLVGWGMSGFGDWQIGRGKPIVTAFLVFAGWSALSATQAVNTGRSFTAIVELSKILLPFLVGVTMLKDEKDWKPVLWTIVLAQGYVGLEMNMNYVLKGYNSAVDGFGGMDNNCFGVSLVTVFGLAIALAMSTKKFSHRALAAASAALILHTTMLTNSRGALMGLLAVGGTALIILPKRPKYLIPFVLAAVLAVRFTGPELAARYASAFVSGDSLDSSAESRLDLWADCLRVVQSAPVLGLGPWNWRAVSSSFGWTQGKSAHSVWMETAAETGVPGVLALLSIFVLAGFKVWAISRERLTDANREEKAVAAGVILSLVGFVVSGQFVSVTGLEA